MAMKVEKLVEIDDSAIGQSVCDDDDQMESLNDGVSTSNICGRDDDSVEERFRVDRRKLEQLIQAAGIGLVCFTYLCFVSFSRCDNINWLATL